MATNNEYPMRPERVVKDEYRVHVPLARGKLIPEMDSIKEDFPALWEPITAIDGRSKSS